MGAARQVRGHARRLELVAELAVELAGPGLADRVDREAAGAVEVDGAGAALDDRDLGDVVRRGLGGERAEERQGHVDAVELVDVVLAAAAGARPAHGVLGVLHAGDELLQVAVLLADRQPWIWSLDSALAIVADSLSTSDASAVTVTVSSIPDAERGVGDRVLGELDLGLAGHGLHAGQGEGERVAARAAARAGGIRRCRR